MADAPRRSPSSTPSENGWLAAPLIGRDGQSLGLLQLADKAEGEFTEDDEAILVQLSRLAAIAIENARLYEELRGNDRRKDEFLAMLAHELRNPLAAIGNAVQPDVAEPTAEEHVDWSMEVIARQMKHLARLIDDLLDVSRITRGKIELRRDVLDADPDPRAVPRPRSGRSSRSGSTRSSSRSTGATSGSTPTRPGSSRSW